MNNKIDHIDTVETELRRLQVISLTVSQDHQIRI